MQGRSGASVTPASSALTVYCGLPAPGRVWANPTQRCAMDDQLDRLAGIGGIIGATVGLAVPIALWFYLLRPWKPKGYFSYAFRWAVWPLVILTFNIGKPIAYLVIGLPVEAPLRVFGLGMVGSLILLSPIAFVAGWIYGGVMKDFKVAPAADGAENQPPS